MPDVVFPLDSTKTFTEQSIVGHNRWHPDIPAQVNVKPGDVFRVALPGVVRRRDPQRRLRRRRPRRPAVHASTCSAARSPSRARSPATCSIVDILDVGPIPQEDYGPAGRAGLGVHRCLRDAERRRLPHRAVPRRLQGDLGLPRSDGDVPARARRLVHRHRAPRPDGDGAVGGAAGPVERRARRRSSPPTRTGCRRWRCRRCRRTRSSARSPAPSSTGWPAEAARTAPPRENGGNQDIKNFTKGTPGLLPRVRARREAVDGRPALLPGRR